MTTIAEIMRFTILRFGKQNEFVLYLRITNKNERDDPHAYLVQYEGNEPVLRRIEKGNKCGSKISPEEHDKQIENFDEVVLYSNCQEIRREKIGDYLKYIYSAI